MKVHEKARLYDELMKDAEEFIQSLEKHHQEVETAEEDPEVKGRESSMRNAALVGKYKGMNFGLLLRIKRFEGKMNWYREQK